MALQFESATEKRIMRNSYVFYATDGKHRFPCIIPCEHLEDLPGNNAERAINIYRARIKADLQRQYASEGLSTNNELVWKPAL